MDKVPKRIVIISSVLLIIIGLFGVKKVIDYNNSCSITYNERTYNKSMREVNDSDMENIKKALNTGIKINGMEVYDIKDNHYNSTVIYLKTKDGKFLMYALSGGG